MNPRYLYRLESTGLDNGVDVKGKKWKKKKKIKPFGSPSNHLEKSNSREK